MGSSRKPPNADVFWKRNKTKTRTAPAPARTSYHLKPDGMRDLLALKLRQDIVDNATYISSFHICAARFVCRQVTGRFILMRLENGVRLRAHVPNPSVAFGLTAHFRSFHTRRSWVRFQPGGLFCVEFACYPRACVGPLRHVSLSGDSVGVSVSASLVSLRWRRDKLATCAGCTPPSNTSSVLWF